MQPERPVELLPLPERRRRRIRPLMVLGAVLFLVGVLIDSDLLWGVGAGMAITAGVGLWLDRQARRPPPLT